MLRFLLYSNTFISLCAAAASYQTFLMLGSVEQRYLFFIFCSTFVFYNGQRLFLSRGYSSTEASERHSWILRNYKLLAWMTFIAFVCAVPVALTWSWRLLGTFTVFSILAALYFLPSINLRSIPLVKAFFVSALWTFSTAAFPALLTGIKSSRLTISLEIQRFLFILPLCVVFNIRDMEFDRSTGTRTLPILVGVEHAKFISVGLIFFYALFALTDPIAQTYRLNLIAPILSSLCAAITLVCASFRRREYYYLLAVDGMILLQAVFYFATWPR